MKIILTISSLLIIGIIIYLFALAYNSKSHTAPGLISGQLSQCPSSKNCICSEYNKDEIHYIEPLSYSSNESSEVLQKIRTTLITMNGVITGENGTYISATFSSKLFGFVDDFEIRLDKNKQLIHMRSASRVGRGDMGANKKRIIDFEKQLNLK